MAVAATPDDSGLPGWLDELLKPGVSPGVFTTLKLSLVSLIIVLSGMLCIIQDSTIRLHVSIFLFMSIVLLVLVVWFISELAKAEALEKVEAKAEAEKKKD